MNINGAVPAFIANMVLSNQPLTLASTNKFLSKYKKEFKVQDVKNDEKPRRYYDFN